MKGKNKHVLLSILIGILAWVSTVGIAACTEMEYPTGGSSTDVWFESDEDGHGSNGSSSDNGINNGNSGSNGTENSNSGNNGLEGDDNMENKVRVSFVVNGEVMETKRFAYGSTVHLADYPTIPEKTGYTAKWDLEILRDITVDTVVTAVYTANYTSLSFDYDGATSGNSMAGKRVYYDEALSELPVPTKRGSTFIGWAYEGQILEEGMIWNYDIKSMTLVATYTVKTYTLTFDYNGADGEYEVVEKYLAYGDKLGELPVTPVKKGYIFDGWYDGLNKLDETSIWDPYNEDEKEFTIIAKWEREPSEGLLFEKSKTENGYVVTGIGSCTDFDVVIPGSYEGLPVLSIASSAFRFCNDIQSVKIPDSVEWIGSEAFKGCYGLISVEIGSGVKSIDNDAFEGCYKLVAVKVDYQNNYIRYLSCGSTSYGYLAYYAKQCTNSSIEEMDSLIINKNGYLFCCDNKGKNYLVGYKNEKTETSLVFPESFNGDSYEIYQYAFYGRLNILSVTIPEKVTAIGTNAFRDCLHMNEVINYSNVDISSAQNVLAKHQGESWLTHLEDFYFLTIDEKHYLIYYGGTTSVTELPQDYNGEAYIIAKYAFYHSELGDLTIPAKVAEIKGDAFYESTLHTVSIEGGVIDGYAFDFCQNLTCVTLGNDVTTVGDYLGSYRSPFTNCRRLIEIVNNSGLNIGYAGDNNNGRYALTIHEGTSWIKQSGDYEFITITNGSNDIHYLVGYCGTDTTLILPENYKGENYQIAKYAFYENTLIENVTISEGVTQIGEYAFAYCSNLTGVVIGDNVTSIGGRVFYSCSSLESITIPENVTSIGVYCFFQCDNLESVYFENTTAIWWVYLEDDGKTVYMDVTDAAQNAELLAHRKYLNGYRYDQGRWYWY